MDIDKSIAQCQVVSPTNRPEELSKEASNIEEERNPCPETGVCSHKRCLMSKPESGRII